jgi:transcription termination factor Rho
LDELEATEFLLDKIKGTKNNADFFDSMRRG